MNNIIYISSNLEKKEKKEEVYRGIDGQNNVINQIVDNGKVYIPLTLPVYAWLRQQMDKAHMAYKSGRLAEDSWGKLRERFYPVHDWAVGTYGQDAIGEAIKAPQANPFVAAVNTIQADTWSQDSGHCYPTDTDCLHSHIVSVGAMAMVNAIQTKAIASGWAEKRLYQNRGKFKFPYGNDYGLICFLNEGQRIGEITSQSIEIISLPPWNNRLRFYNQDAELPWMKKCK